MQMPPNSRATGEPGNNHGKILKELEQLAHTAPTAQTLMQGTVNKLRESLVWCNWIAFYLVDARNPRMLLMGPCSGMDTPHKSISFDEGLCGAAASTGK